MLPFHSGGSRWWGASSAIIFAGFFSYAALAADGKKSPKPTRADKTKAEAKAKAESGKPKSHKALGGIPLPIGQEAKGLVLPDYDTEGKLRARFEAGTAKRIDAERIQFSGLKMTTFSPEEKPDLHIDMPDATLDLNTRVITSTARTAVTRSDFNIAGDTMKFDTNERTGTLVGNVKMVITDSSGLTGKKTK